MKRNDKGGELFKFTGDLCESCSHVVVCEAIRRLRGAVSDIHFNPEITVTVCGEHEAKKEAPL